MATLRHAQSRRDPHSLFSLPDDPHSLFSLPDELLVQVIAHLSGDNETLCTLARTSRFFQIEAEKHIYNTIELFSTNNLHAIIEAFTRRPERIASVDTLKILYRFHEGLDATSEERDVFNRSVVRMNALRNWEIESPYDNYKWDVGGEEWVRGDMEDFRNALETASLKMQGKSLIVPSGVGLAKLERLTIHTHGMSDDFWNLGDYHCLFRHPALRYLHVSCLALPKDIPELEPYAKSTPLIELVFDECELEPKSLGRILATPKSLKRLTLGENVYNVNNTRGLNPRLTRAPEATLAALAHVAPSLESLTHYDPTWNKVNEVNEVNFYLHTPLPGPGMRAFHRLTCLHVDACSFLHRSFVLSHTQAPPNLNLLRIRRPRQRYFDWMGGFIHDSYFDRLPPHDLYTYLPALRTLEFVQGASLDTNTAGSAYICKPDSLAARHAAGYQLHQHGINLRVSLEAIWRDRLIPPFLHSEPPPELVCVYDAAVQGFVRPRSPSSSSSSADTAETTNTDALTAHLTDAQISAHTATVSALLRRLFQRMRTHIRLFGDESLDPPLARDAVWEDANDVWLDSDSDGWHDDPLDELDDTDELESLEDGFAPGDEDVEDVNDGTGGDGDDDLERVASAEDMQDAGWW